MASTLRFDQSGRNHSQEGHEIGKRFQLLSKCLYITHKHPYQARNSIVRHFLLSDLSDAKLLELRENNVMWGNTPPFIFVNSDHVKQLLVDLALVADNIYTRILDLQEDKLTRFLTSLRFASVIYTCQLLIHPFSDLNKRTAFYNAMSYISELNPDAIVVPQFPVSIPNLHEFYPTISTPQELGAIRGELAKHVLPDLVRFKSLEDTDYIKSINHVTESEIASMDLGSALPLVSYWCSLGMSDVSACRHFLTQEMKLKPRNNTTLDQQLAAALLIRQTFREHIIQTPVHAFNVWLNISEVMTLVLQEVGHTYDVFDEVQALVIPASQQQFLKTLLKYALNTNGELDLLNYVLYNSPTWITGNDMIDKAFQNALVAVGEQLAAQVVPLPPVL